MARARQKPPTQQAQGQELALREATQGAVAQFQNDDFTQQIARAVPEGVSPRQLLRAASTAVLETPDLAKPALRGSLLQATLKCAQDGLLPDGREAVFVIYKTRDGDKVQYQPMISGLRKIAADHGWTLDTKAVYANDDFDPDFDTGKPNHKPARLGSDRGAILGAYAAAQHRDGRRMLEIMDEADIERVRSRSRAKDNGPWVDWWDRMAEKTVGKRLFKKLGLDPKDRRVVGVLQALEDDDDPVGALYGTDHSAPAAGEAATPRAASPAPEHDDEPEEAEWTDEPGDAGDAGAQPLNEPSDEELAALGAAEPEGEGAPNDDGELRFPRGKYEGWTIADVYADGAVGAGYLKWAVRDWEEGDLKAALRDFVSSHPDLSG